MRETPARWQRKRSLENARLTLPECSYCSFGACQGCWAYVDLVTLAGPRSAATYTRTKAAPLNFLSLLLFSTEKNVITPFSQPLTANNSSKRKSIYRVVGMIRCRPLRRRRWPCLDVKTCCLLRAFEQVSLGLFCPIRKRRPKISGGRVVRSGSL